MAMRDERQATVAANAAIAKQTYFPGYRLPTGPLSIGLPHPECIVANWEVIRQSIAANPALYLHFIEQFPPRCGTLDARC
jgi:hypothetical protein